MNKTDRRHELQQNDLAAYLEQANKRIEPYSKQILVAILLVLAVLVAYSFYNSEIEADSSMATMELIQNTNVPSQDSAALSNINTEFIETSAGKLAKLYEGMALVSQGNQDIYTERELAVESLNSGIEVLTAAANNTDDDLIKSRAHLGVALANVTLGNNENAIKAYKQVIAANESEAMVENATSRIESLKSPSSEEFATWFQTADFTPPVMPNLDPSLPPVSGIPGIPDFDPDMNLPELTTPTPGTNADGEANPLEGEAAPRDLDGGLDLPADAEKAAPADAGKAAPADAEKVAPADAEKVAPADADKAAPADADKAAPAEAEKAAPAEAEKAAPAEAEKAAPADAEKAAEGSAADNSATDK